MTVHLPERAAASAEIDERFARRIAAAVCPPYRGQIYENTRRFRLVGKAYEALHNNYPEQDGSFWIESARHLEWVLRALLDPAVRIVILIGATQVLKSVVGDIWVPYIMEHNPRNMLVLFEDDPKAQMYCDIRLMETIKQHPVLKHRLGDVQRLNRHDVTTTKIKMPGMTLQAGGLNDGNLSSFAWPLLWISESWQHKSDGMLGKAIKRMDRFPNDCKALVESQAGMVGEDLHMLAQGAHPVPLSWACPFCGGRQTWDFTQERPGDFVARVPSDPPPGWSPPKPGTYAGMTFDPEERVLPDGRKQQLNTEERARTARWNCYHCGIDIEDTRAMRRTLMDSYQQDYQITLANGEKVSPAKVCFYLPKECAQDNRFSNSVESYLTAKEAHRLGNEVPLQNWYMSERATFFDPKLVQQRARVLLKSVDLEAGVPNEAARLMMVDCQQDDEATKAAGGQKSIIGHFWYVAWAVDKQSNIYQLARGYAKSWKEWVAIQKGLKIPNKNVAMDGGNWLHEVIDWAAANFEVEIETNKGKKIRWHHVCKVMRGNGLRRSWKWTEDGLYRPVAPPSYYDRWVEVQGKRTGLQVPVYEWSNLSVKDQLFSLRMGGPGKPQMTVLPREKLDPQTQEMERGNRTYENQIQNEYRTQKNGKDIWLESDPNVHYKDCECMGLVLCGLGGLIGHTAAPEEVVGGSGE